MPIETRVRGAAGTVSQTAIDLDAEVVAVPVGPGPVAPVLAAEEAAGQRRPDRQPHAVGLGHRGQLALDPPIEQVVRRLLGDEAVQVMLLRRPQPLKDLPGGKAARADVAHGAGAHQVIVQT